ncbi:MAG: complex I NDUFA9 subunit family protein [Burkholderiales bacterium]|nr:complex I NDUFA9 subunit family protein [Burkholderiales bacterium]
MKKVLVLGGTGFVGGHVCEKLVRAGWHVTVPTRRTVNARRVQHLPGLTVFELDVHNEMALARAMAGHDAVVNLVAILHGDATAFDKTHVILVQKMLRACRTAAVHRLVHISALGVNGERPGSAPSEYLRSKGRGEAVLLHPADPADRPQVTSLRPSVIFGADDKFLNLFAKLQAVLPFMPLAGATARFQPVWVEDVANAVVRSLQVGRHAVFPQIVEACGPEIYTLRQMVQLAARLGGVNEGLGRPVLAIPDWLGRLQARMMELAPGAPLMSRDNLNSMKVDNVATGKLPGLQALGIQPAALQPIAGDYLGCGQVSHGLLGIRNRNRI